MTKIYQSSIISVFLLSFLISVVNANTNAICVFAEGDAFLADPEEELILNVVVAWGSTDYNMSEIEFECERNMSICSPGGQNEQTDNGARFSIEAGTFDFSSNYRYIANIKAANGELVTSCRVGISTVDRGTKHLPLEVVSDVSIIGFINE
jgi:hypothetical protein